MKKRLLAVALILGMGSANCGDMWVHNATGEEIKVTGYIKKVVNLEKEVKKLWSDISGFVTGNTSEVIGIVGGGAAMAFLTAQVSAAGGAAASTTLLAGGSASVAGPFAAVAGIAIGGAVVGAVSAELISRAVAGSPKKVINIPANGVLGVVPFSGIVTTVMIVIYLLKVKVDGKEYVLPATADKWDSKTITVAKTSGGVKWKWGLPTNLNKNYSRSSGWQSKQKNYMQKLADALEDQKEYEKAKKRAKELGDKVTKNVLLQFWKWDYKLWARQKNAVKTRDSKKSSFNRAKSRAKDAKNAFKRAVGGDPWNYITS